MNLIRCTLISDGSSDRALLPILTWLFNQHFPDVAVDPNWVDFGSLRYPPKSLAARIQTGVDLYPCEVLFIHRDAEAQPAQERRNEINRAMTIAAQQMQLPRIVCVIPIRMQEAWLLIDEQAIRDAAGNPNGRVALPLPRVDGLESITDPKDKLYELLALASGLTGRRLSKFNPREHTSRVADFIEDFSPLRQLSAFQALEDDIQRLIL